MDQSGNEIYEGFSLNFRLSNGIPINTKELELFNYSFSGNKTTCKASNIDGFDVLEYTIPATLPLDQFLFKQLYKGEFLVILSNILSQFIYFEDNNMPLKKIMLNTKYMYIELYNLDIQLIYMPADKQFVDLDIIDFVKKFIEKIRFADMQCASCIDTLLSYLDSNTPLSLKELYAYVLNLEEKKISETTENMNHKHSNAGKGYNITGPCLIRLRNNELISIDSDIFNIGKSVECQYQIKDNKKISRMHCTLKLNNGICHIMDNGSTNHTYINGRLIQPDEDILLNDSDYIRMADEEFKYWVR